MLEQQPTHFPDHSMSDFDPASWQLVRNGVFNMHGTHAVNTDVSKAEAAAKVAPLNHPEWIEEAFVKKADQVIHLSDERVVTIMEPTGKYSPHSVIVTAIDKDALYTQPGVTRNDDSYDREHSAVYNRQIVGLMLAMNESIPEHLRTEMSIFSTENAVLHRTNETYRTPRSIDVRHAQVNMFRNTDIDDVDPEADLTHQQKRLAEEQMILQRKAMDGFIKRIKSTMENSGQAAPEMGIRSTAPYGYYIEVPYDPYDIAQDRNGALMGFTDLISSHYRAYREVSPKYENLAQKIVGKVKEDPTALIPSSFREYRALTPEGKLLIIVSPVFWAPSGVVEAAGVNFARGEHFPQRMPNVSKDEVYRRLDNLITTPNIFEEDEAVSEAV